MTDITQLPQDPANTAPTLTDLIAAWRVTTTSAVAYTVAELRYGLQAAVTLSPLTLWANPTSGSAAPVATALGAGLGFGSGALLATGADHLGFERLSAFDGNAEIIVNSAGVPARMPMALFQIGGGAVAGVLSAALDAAFGTTEGQVLYRGAAGWSALAPGGAGALLASGGGGAAPTWTTFQAAFDAWFSALPTTLPVSGYWNDGGTLAKV